MISGSPVRTKHPRVAKSEKVKGFHIRHNCDTGRPSQKVNKDKQKIRQFISIQIIRT
jgi:hypothetical protein